jgi:hypothetical protein
MVMGRSVSSGTVRHGMRGEDMVARTPQDLAALAGHPRHDDLEVPG